MELKSKLHLVNNENKWSDYMSLTIFSLFSFSKFINQLYLRKIFKVNKNQV